LLHIPHASEYIPEDVTDQFVCSKMELRREVQLMTDHHTDWLVQLLEVADKSRIIAPVSRLVVDMERFDDDSVEVMSQVGMGAIYEKGSQQQTIRRKLTQLEKSKLLKKYYYPHHEALEARAESLVNTYGKAIIIDVHSYPSTALPYERDHTLSRPEICIGCCDFHTPKGLETSVVSAFEQEGFDVAINTPFSGTLVPSKFWRTSENVIGFMIEIRRDVYMDEDKFCFHQHSDSQRTKICNAISQGVEKFKQRTI